MNFKKCATIYKHVYLRHMSECSFMKSIQSFQMLNYFLVEFFLLASASKASLNSLYPSVFLNSSSLIPSSSSLDSES